jgi:hypothetical protein
VHFSAVCARSARRRARRRRRLRRQNMWRARESPQPQALNRGRDWPVFHEVRRLAPKGLEHRERHVARMAHDPIGRAPLRERAVTMASLREPKARSSTTRRARSGRE